MENTFPARPHTVSAMSRPYHPHSDNIMKILEEIEREARMPPTSPSKKKNKVYFHSLSYKFMNVFYTLFFPQHFCK